MAGTQYHYVDRHTARGWIKVAGPFVTVKEAEDAMKALEARVPGAIYRVDSR
jgi:hypothetical protein